MIVLVLENVSPSLRGEISRWLFEIKAGVFAGRVSALVRDELWALIEDKVDAGSALLIYPQRNEQGFDARMLGNPSRTLVDIEGVLLVKVQ
ncbi:type I-E CRISPR-associated endoribonuclease Cas2e [Oscillatoria sp. CS-180]|uniref:type I-E CRISPR-associated endoribonuclease Cas2e n=1 Tax=Oscillatoria sp. CS-180 TaxID=3021720 RepID=UPI00232E8E3E|nr:type I-E CRISPR-associated endoribonuclease Cas2e [Oscillatoria sp. CS-180]MDB9524392.1 type I-E CRISPR-associated endoribonuclease Cas2e [Oscillatoria sp. CS-180]